MFKINVHKYISFVSTHTIRVLLYLVLLNILVFILNTILLTIQIIIYYSL